MRRVVSQRVSGAEHDLVLVDAELDPSPRLAMRASSPSARAGTIASSSGTEPSVAVSLTESR